MNEKLNCPLCKKNFIDLINASNSIIANKKCVNCLYTIQIFNDKSVLLMYPDPNAKVFNFRNFGDFDKFIRFKAFH